MPSAGRAGRAPFPRGGVGLGAKLAPSKDPQPKSLAQSLAVTFGSKVALGQMRKTLADASSPEAQRKAAIDTLVASKDAETLPLLQSLLSDAALRDAAIRGLAGFDDAKTPSLIVDAYASLDASAKRDAINTLASRPAYATALLDAVDAKKLSATDVTADVVRQLRY